MPSLFAEIFGTYHEAEDDLKTEANSVEEDEEDEERGKEYALLRSAIHVGEADYTLASHSLRLIP